LVWRVAKGALGIAVLAFLAWDILGGSLGLTKNGLSATVGRADYPIVFWVLTALIAGFGLQIIYNAVFDNSPEQ
jgi:hypothetical protein